MELNSEKSKAEIRRRRRVGLIYDERMCKHFTPDGDYHPENPNRILSIWNKLQSAGIPKRCVVLRAKEVEDKYLAAVHSKNHIDLIKNISSKKFDSRRERIAANFGSIYFNQGSSEAAYLAAGSVIEVTEKVAKGELDSAFAIVRPPGHHAEEDEPMGFCLYNNVAVATSFLLNERELGINKILIVDWDVHHGNGTQKMFWKDSRVLFFSVHRHEFGSFYPANDDGSHIMIGEGPGAGYNINVPWENGRCGDADYLAVWEHVLIPVAKEFSPDIIIVSAGFDAAVGDPLGGCRVTPYGYSVLLKKVREELSTFWPILKDELPMKVTTRKAPPIQISSSDSDVENDNGPCIVSEDLEKAVRDVVQPFSELRVGIDSNDKINMVSAPWRLELSKTDVWYATYGSNMCKSRFLCYIEGGQVEGMRKPCAGSLDKSPPKEILWKTLPHRLFFGRDQTKAWGPGGAAFLHPESNSQDKAYMCLYRITLEQFNDVLLQENVSSCEMNSPAFDLTDLDSITKRQFILVEALKRGWYHNVIYLGNENGIPILTMTCTLSDIESFKSGKSPLCAPAKEYANTLVRGLVDGKQFSDEEAGAYILEASTKAL